MRDSRFTHGDLFLNALWEGKCESYWESKYDGISYDRPTDFEAVRRAIKESHMDCNEDLWLRYLAFLESDPDLFVYFSC